MTDVDSGSQKVQHESENLLFPFAVDDSSLTIEVKIEKLNGFELGGSHPFQIR